MKTLFKRIGAGIAMAAIINSPIYFAQAAQDRFYEALGGEAGVAAIANDLVNLALSDPRIKDTFEDVDLERLKSKLAEQFCELSGGPCKYSGKDMTLIHDGLGISNAQFNALAEDLQIALERNAIPSHVQNKLIARLAPMQRNIVTK
ncbi:MAG: group 1 truncated hemoglobin [Pseudomonadota bacterium]